MNLLYTLKVNAKACVYLAMASLLVLQGCSGAKTFHQVARAGDTIAISAGYQEFYTRDNITVYVYPADGSPFLTFGPDNPLIRAVVNFYPDPVSSLLVSRRTGQNLTPFAETYASSSHQFADTQHDWFSTTVFFDLPGGLPPGSTDIYIDDPQGNEVATNVQIIAGTGNSHTFEANVAGELDRQKLSSLERVGHYKVSFSGTTVPAAVQLDFTHDPDVDNSGTGKAYAVDPISGIKNISWTDDGTNMRVIITPTETNLLTTFGDFRFYVAGGILNLANTAIEAYDIDGNVVSGVIATVDTHNITISNI